MENKYNLSRGQNMFLAKKKLVESVYHSAKLESINVTFPQTQTILDGVSVSNMNMDDVQTILNLRNAWKHCLNTIGNEFNLDFIKKINSFVAYNESLDWGVLRYGSVGISGVSYRPSIPVEKEVIEQMTELLAIENTTERALKYMLWAMRSQLFWDGNKRTSIICANKILIENGNGVLMVPEESLVEFNEKLAQFYESNDYDVILDFLYDKCIFGIDFA